MNKIRVAAVSYLNTKPLLYGIRKSRVAEQIVLIEDYPAKIAQMLIEDTVDIGLIPVAATTRLSEWHIIGNYCIGAEGPVASVCIFSEVPMEAIETVYLDYQSRTSVALAKILLKDYWKKKVTFIDALSEDYRSKISGTAAGVVIGDRALEQRLVSAYIYDLASAWIDHTGLPFVFAAWIANKKLPAAFVKAFDEANAYGLAHLPEVIAANGLEAYSLEKYYNENISYDLTERKKEGLKAFLSLL